MKREPKENALQRMKDADDFLNSAEDNFLRGRFKVTVDNAVDGVIAANDAFTIWLVEQLATTDHREAVKLHIEAGKKINSNKSQILGELLELRHQKTYRPVTVSKATAEEALRKAKSFDLWVKDRMKI